MSLSTIITIILIVVILAIVVVYVLLPKLRVNDLFSDYMVEKKHTPTAISALKLLAIGKSDEAYSELKAVSATMNAPIFIYTTLAVMARVKEDYKLALQINEGLILRKDLDRPSLVEITRELARCYKVIGITNNTKECLTKLETLKVPELLLIKAMLVQKDESELIDGTQEAIKLYKIYQKLTGINVDEEIAKLEIQKAMDIRDFHKRTRELTTIQNKYPASNLPYTTLIDHYIEHNKPIQAIEVAKEMVKNDLIHSNRLMEKIEGLFYEHSSIDDLFNIALTRVSAETVNPIPHLFVYNYFKKKNNIDRAKSILKKYLTDIGNSTEIAKEYISLLGDPLIMRAARLEDTHYCIKCKIKLSKDYETCPSCGAEGGITLL